MPAHPHHDTLLLGLVGQGIQSSRSPAMHMAEARAHGLTALYRLFDTATDLAAVLDAAQRLEFDGLNVTHPFKIAVLDHLHDLSDNARALGAVNTVRFHDGRRIGHNTDWWGFAESLHQGLPGAARNHVLLLGAGGAGLAMAHALAVTGTRRLSLFDPDAGRAAALVTRMQGIHPALQLARIDDPAPLLRDSPPDGLVNATPVGMASHPGSPVSADLLRAPMWVADAVYFPLNTQLLMQAAARGCATLSGQGMAIHQAVRAFELFSGRAADPARMAATFASFDA